MYSNNVYLVVYGDDTKLMLNNLVSFTTDKYWPIEKMSKYLMHHQVLKRNNFVKIRPFILDDGIYITENWQEVVKIIYDTSYFEYNIYINKCIDEEFFFYETVSNLIEVNNIIKEHHNYGISVEQIFNYIYYPQDYYMSCRRFLFNKNCDYS